MNIVFLLIKHTGTLDFILPVLWKLKQKYPEANVSVVYCSFSRYQFLRRSQFYPEMLQQWQIAEYDFASFLPGWYGASQWFWRRLCAQSQRDMSSNHQPSSLMDKAAYRWIGWRQKIQAYLTHKARVEQILTRLQPDVVLFDNVFRTQFHGREHTYNYLAKNKTPVMLLPHAPHHASTTTFTPFDEQGEALPDYCQCWMPFKYDQYWQSAPQQKEQFVYVGYPGLDSEWLNYLLSFKPQTKTKSNQLKCLFIIRRFLPQSKTGAEEFVYEYDEFVDFLDRVGEAIKAVDADITLVVKPHPSNNFQSVKDIFSQSSIEDWQISYEPVYALISECDLVISLYSTILLIPAMANIPVILINSRIQQELHQQEPTNQSLYTGLPYFTEPEDLPAKLSQSVHSLSQFQSEKQATNDQLAKHLRSFYPDGAISRCLNQIVENI